MFQALLNFFGGGILGEIGEQLNRAYQAKLDADTNEKKMEIDAQISQLQLRQSILVAEQKRWLTAWVRPALALPVVIVVWKLLVWDYVLGLGVTPQPGELIKWIIVTTIGAYMLTRPFERR